ncbi:hypothetical protein HYALB_00006694 [Hymenoscyphus albidus]|uniref:Exonuclease domain-containing protein n=1 Tax=Hymenoscyphus albidus TaxID=595503 RepID=A0A9N9Q0F6_9HELO|nr:hypothetical protein HYALB_00006694 [Hymenoscyphus albidus]
MGNAHEQRYEYLCIVDFEASISKTQSGCSQEMIEFPLVLISTTNTSLEVIDEFHTFIQPRRNLPGKNRQEIPQRVLDESPIFPEAWEMLLLFLERHKATESNTLAITCGDWDFRTMLPTEQTFYGISGLPLFERWCNIKHAFKAFTGKKADSMVRMLNVIGQELIGTHHSGIDDARNIASIVRWLYQQRHAFRVTSDGSIDEQALQHQQVLQLEKAEWKRATEEARIAKLSVGATPPQEMFQSDLYFSAWDDEGIPTHLADGTPLSKSAISKRKKLWRVQKSLHEKYLAWQDSKVEV